VATVTGRPVRVEPGDVLGARDREPDPEAGQRVGLADRSDHDQIGVGHPEAYERGADELGVGLVEHDDRGVAAAIAGVGRERGQKSLDMAVGLGQGRRVVRAA